MQETRDIHGSKVRRGLILSAVFLVIITAGLLLWMKYFPIGSKDDHSGTILVQAEMTADGNRP